jgi:16S rRNA (uracil1498-N3)-methyltransferase
VNLLLVDPAELAGDATCTLRDRRALHLRTVLGASVGAQVRAGVIGGGIGTALVLADDGAAITLQLAITDPAPAPLPIELVLAIPRPKVLTRVIEAAAAFGVARIELTNAWRVDKSYLHSPRLASDALALAARLGAEQGATTHLPAITIHRRLMALLDARWPGPRVSEAATDDALPAPAPPAAPTSPVPPPLLDAHAPGPPQVEATPPAPFVAHAPGPAQVEATPPAPLDAHAPSPPQVKLIAHPGAPPIETVLADPAAPLVLAIGPEGGWIAREVDTFVARGFAPVSLGAPILRVEAAVAAALGQLLLLERLRRW